MVASITQFPVRAGDKRARGSNNNKCRHTYEYLGERKIADSWIQVYMCSQCGATGTKKVVMEG